MAESTEELNQNTVAQQIKGRWDRLTKPPGSLGDLEDWICRLGEIQGSNPPRIDPARMLLFAGDHGVAEENVSAYPQSVTRQMLANIDDEGAAINAMTEQVDMQFEWFNVGSHSSLEKNGGKVSEEAGNIRRENALTSQERRSAIQVGRLAVEAAQHDDVSLIGLGEIGIANTTPSTALIAAILERDPETVVGSGTGLDEDGLAHKTQVIREIIQNRSYDTNNASDLLETLGGFEIAAMTGAIFEAHKRGIPVVLDGLITTAAALVASIKNDGVSNVLMAAHTSAEPGHEKALDELGLEPMVDLNLRLGEGTGAALILPLLRVALNTYTSMATFEEAGVTDTDQ